MVQKLIELALRNRLIVLLIAGCLFAWGILSIKQNPIDAIPDLSENQVIVFTEWMGRSPQVIEDQVTYPLVSNLQGIPKIKNIRGSSMFGMSFVYVIFEDNVDIYWARTRVLERLNYAQRLLPQGITPTLGPDGTGVGHIFWYHLDAPKMDLGEQRALPLFAAGDYGAALKRLAGLRPAVDAFFDKVMVMVDDAAVRDNRLALLNSLSELFLGAADISRLQS